jgi:hypothetical protein
MHDYSWYVAVPEVGLRRSHAVCDCITCRIVGFAGKKCRHAAPEIRCLKAHEQAELICAASSASLD